MTRKAHLKRTHAVLYGIAVLAMALHVAMVSADIDVPSHYIIKVFYQTDDQLDWLTDNVAPMDVTRRFVRTDVNDRILKLIKTQGYEIEIENHFQGSIHGAQQAQSYQLTEAGLYHSYSELKTELLQLETLYPNLAKVFDIGDTWEKSQGMADRDILAIKISDNVAVDEEEAESLFVGAHHAREWISVEVPFLLAKHLLENYDTDPTIRSYVDNGEIWIVPMVNPDGHQYSIDVERWWRKNRRNNGGSFGVDLNRNYGFEWGGPGSSGDPNSDTYRGASAFSEPETQAIRDLALQHDFQAIITYHNYGQLILYPWGYTNAAAPEQDLFMDLTQTMSDLIFGVHGRTYTPQQSDDLYITSGTTDDWFYGELAAYCFTIELRPQGFPFFELPESEIQSTWEENRPAVLHMIEWSQIGEPLPDIKANGSDEKITIQTSDTLDVSASLISGNRDSGGADWWLLAQTPAGYYGYDAVSGSWRRGLRATYQGALADYGPSQVLNMSGLPVGSYTFYFGVDMDVNNIVDDLYLFSDSVMVDVLP